MYQASASKLSFFYRIRLLSFTYLGMVAIMFDGAESFKQIVKNPSIECSMWNLVKIGQAVSEKTFKDYTI